MSWQSDQNSFKRAIQRGTSVSKLLKESKNRPSKDGLAVYQNAHEIRLRDFLSDDFIVTKKLLGKRFERLAHGYRLEYPSNFYSAADYGRYFPEFLRVQKWVGAEAAFPDLANFEWQMNELLFAVERPVEGIDKITAATEVDWLQARLLFDPSHRFVCSDFPIDSIYEEESWHPGAGVDLLLWRQDGEALYRRVTLAEKELLIALAAGLRLEALADRELTLAPEVFSDWLSSGLVRGIRWK
jgi:hypothetical protein